ncbi:MAG TPA: ATP synthase F1 subunit gamma [Anaerolineaceae bacterium]|nr:ATP synthase F1 subunit gamma [Anaerolineaceae bacterium]
MPSARDMRLRIRSVKNIAQVTKALETVSASKVRKAVQLYQATRPYAEKAWKVLVHLARQPGHNSLHPLLCERSEVKNVLVVMISSDRGLAGSYNVNILRHTLNEFNGNNNPVSYIAVGRKGRDMMVRRRKDVIAEFSNLPPAPSFMDVSAIGRLAVDDYLSGQFDQVYLAYTRFNSMVNQQPMVSKLLPLDIHYEKNDSKDNNLSTTHKTSGVFTYEPDQEQILSQIVPRFTALQIYQAILSAMASEHAARMMAMHNATDNARELIEVLQLDYNKARQQAITNDILDITGGAEALAQVLAG